MAATSIEKLQKKLSKEPNSLVFMQLAEEYRKDGQVDDALRVLQDGLKRHPNYWTARVSIGRIHYESGDLVRALEELEIVIRAVPGNLLANRMLGDIYLRQNRPQEALRRYKVVQMLNPADQEVSAHIQQLEAHLSDARSAETAPTVMMPAVKLPVVETPAELIEEAIPEPEPVESEPPLVEAGMQPAAAAIADTQEALKAAIQAELQTDAPPSVMPAPAMEMEEFVDLGTIGPRDEDSYWNLAEPTPQQVSITDPAPIETIQEPVSKSPETPWNRTNEMPMGEKPRQPDLSGIAGMLLEPEPDSNEFVDVREVPVIAADQEIQEDSFEELDSGELEQVLEEGQDETPPDRTQPMEEEESEVDESADELTSESLAELYASQGLTDRAIKVYQKMLLNDPNNPRIVQRLQELNPIDAFLAVTAQEEARADIEEEPALRWETTDPMIPVRSVHDSHIDDRRKKITTLENWLASIRKERS